MRAAVFSDVHGNLIALDAVLAAADRRQVEEWWIVGDLVALGPQPAETVSRLMSLRRAQIVRGNTDRYVTTGELSDAVPSLDVTRTPDESRTSAATIAAHAWTRGCVTAAGGYDWLAHLPLEVRVVLPDGTRALLVHASPGSDDGPGVIDDMTDEDLAADGWNRADADLIFVGHTHRPLDRIVDSTRIVNVGSVSLPATAEPAAMWTLLDATEAGYRIERCLAPYDLDAVAQALDDSRHPSAAYLRARLLAAR